ncbi:hypothetical protein REPUB_Repub03eG0214700 [Reevesia pubescens]
MAGICCGVVGESEAAAPVEATSRASRRRRMEIRPFKLIADAAVQPPLENGRKRLKLDLDRFILPSPRGCDNAVQNSDTNKLEKDQEINEGLNSNGTVKLEIKKLIEDEKECPKFGMTSVCGRRRDMEDAVSIQVQILSDIHFFGVFDGHGCSHVAMKCRDRFHEIVKEEIEACGGAKAVEWKLTMEKSFERMDKEPDRPDELTRIEEAGGRVIYWDGPRVLGVLAMSRAIGDNYLKPFVIPEPEVTITERKVEDECLILASDGLWDVVKNETACGVARMCLRAQRQSLPPGSPDAAVKGGGAAESSDEACWDASILLTKLALARHSTDNVSVVVVDLKKNQHL